ncbi:MAG: DUF4254 domain-containing protein [Lutibacter sp.]|nr:DUF4254 domain-containing protein [Lutibacter sp.]MDP3944315.1 DUF4254 domain-containing protein [Lutibacter sp.]
MKTKEFNEIFDEVISNYHIIDDVNQAFKNPYDKNSFEHLIYRKCWIDTVQWHYEDIIRLPNIDPLEAITLKRKIDASNQDRTDTVEFIDSYFLNKYKDVSVKEDARVNTETPAWAIDRLSILALKIYHMNEEAIREDASYDHRAKCKIKRDILLEQRVDLTLAIDQLIADIENGTKFMKVYKQMKMYNDEDTNPMLYKK